MHTGRANDGAKHVYWEFDYVWNNDGDTAILKNPSGATVDTCKYTGSGSSVAC